MNIDYLYLQMVNLLHALMKKSTEMTRNQLLYLECSGHTITGFSHRAHLILKVKLTLLLTHWIK